MIPQVDVYIERGSLLTKVGRAHFNLRRNCLSTTFSYDETQGLAALAAECGIQSHQASEMVHQVIAAMSQWRKAAKKNGCSAAEIQLFEPVFREKKDALLARF